MKQERYKLLMIEDDPFDAKLLRRSLGDNQLVDFDIVEEFSLEDALRRLSSERFDLVLLDLNLPDSLPKQAAKTFLSRCLNLPVVVVSGYSDDSVAIDAVRQGAQDFISKNELGLQKNALALKLLHAIDRHHLARTVSQVKKADQAKSRFLAMMSHEVRTPINGIMGMSQLALNQPLNIEVREYIEHIRSSADQLLRVTNDILDFAKIEADKVKLQFEDFDLPKLIEQQVCAHREFLGAKSVSIDWHYDENLDSYFHGDRLRILQVLSNFISNAVKFTDRGLIQVCVRRNTSSLEGATSRVRFEVQDSGMGIEQNELDHIFDPFEQVEKSASTNHLGSGLGLWIAKRLVLLMGGQIGADSRNGSGSLFWFELDLMPVEQSHCSKKESSSLLQISSRIKKSYKKILIAEDNPINQLVTKKLLDHLGIESDIVADGVSLLEYLEKYEYSMILLDLQMPRLDGYEATRIIRLKSNADIASIPIIAVTANAMKDDRLNCLKAGMNDYISKPFVLKDLAMLVSKWLNKPACSKNRNVVNLV